MLRRLAWLIILLTACAQTSPPQPPTNATPLLSNSLIEWYRGQTSAAPDARYFGAWVMAAAGDALYLGLNPSVPVHEQNGALIARYDVDGLTLIPGYAEQDINRMQVTGDTIYIPGYDPLQGWDAGTLYALDTQTNTLNALRYEYEPAHFVDSTVTDALGNYAFLRLKPSSYTVRFVLPSGWNFTQANAGNDFYNDSNPDETGHDTTCQSYRYPGLRFILPVFDVSIDAGLVESAGASAQIPTEGARDESFYGGQFSIGDQVWNDTNRNGLLEIGEPFVEGVRVELYTRAPFFPCVLHANGVWVDEQGTIYYNGGLLPNGNVTWRSVDGGVTWDFFDEDLGNYWATDIVGAHDTLYMLHEAYTFGSTELNTGTVLRISESGQPWQTFAGVPVEGTQTTFSDDGESITVNPSAFDQTNRMIVFRGDMIILHPNGDRLYRFTGGSDYEVIQVEGVDFSGILPDFLDPEYANLPITNRQTGMTNHYNVLVNANDEQLYVIGSDNAVYMTEDLIHWRKAADFHADGAPLIALTYWAERDIIIAATAGDYANLYTIQRNSAGE